MAQKILLLLASGESRLIEGDPAVAQYRNSPLVQMLADGWVVRSVTPFGGSAGTVAVLLEKHLSSDVKNARGEYARENLRG